MTHKKVFSGFLNDCSPQQLEVLEKFRERVKEMGSMQPKYDDIYLLRFCRARKFDLEKITEMWKNFINWRKEKNVDAIATYDFPELKEAKQYYPHFWYRTDKQGRPMFIERPGKVQIDKLNKIMSGERLEHHYIHDYERLLNEIFPACSKVKGELVNTTCYILDLKGVSAKMMSPKIWDFLKRASRIGQDYYPEILGVMYIVNTPLFFHGAWQIIKGFFDEKTRKKVHILGTGFKKELLQNCDENELPDFLGGKLTEADYGANCTIEQGPWINNSAKVPNSADNATNLSSEQRNSTSMKDDSETEVTCPDSLRQVPKQHKCLEELIDGEFPEIEEEIPERNYIKYFQAKASGQFC